MDLPMLFFPKIKLKCICFKNSAEFVYIQYLLNCYSYNNTDQNNNNIIAITDIIATLG